MRLYDFMTMVWAVLWAVPTGVIVFLFAQSNNNREGGFVLGGIATMAMVVCVVFWRMFKDPGRGA